MTKRDRLIETGTVIDRGESWRGPVLSVAVTLTEREWDELTSDYAIRWLDAEDDLDVRTLTREECIALFLTDAIEGWMQRLSSGSTGDDIDEGMPF